MGLPCTTITYIPFDATRTTRINIWFRGGKLSGFEITSNFYFGGGGEGEEENDTSD